MLVLTIIIFLTVGSTRNYKELKNYFIYSLNTNFEENFEDWRKAYSEFNSYSNFPMLIENTSIKMADSYASERNIFKIKKPLIMMKNKLLLKNMILKTDII